MIFVQTNEADANAVVAFRREPNGRLTPLGATPTGGRGNGMPHLPSQGSLTVAGNHLLVVNAGSGELSVLAIAGDVLSVTDRAATSGMPVSGAPHDGTVRVLNGGLEPSIAGFALTGGKLTPTATRALTPGSDPAQIAFTPDGRQLVVTERGTNSITLLGVSLEGEPATHPSAGATPYGFDFASGTLIVTEAFGGQAGAAAASSYRLAGGILDTVSASVRDERSEVCWAVASADGRTVWVTNFGDGTISRYAVGSDGALELADAVAASTVLGTKGIRDAARTADGTFLYALDADARQVFGWRIERDGRLEPTGAVNGLPATAAGLAAL
jgi:6-phosphogluconolactonase (cycloisomerase 2 family)